MLLDGRYPTHIDELSIPQAYQTITRRLVQSKQGRSQHVVRRQGLDPQHQGRQGQDYGQHSWHRPQL